MLWYVYVTSVTIIRNSVLEQLLVCVLPCCCRWCLVEQFIKFLSTRIATYTIHMTVNFLTVPKWASFRMAADCIMFMMNQ